jgi:uncharacterized repeat protein (TIGR01451 family)
MSIRKGSANTRRHKRHRAISFLVAVCGAMALTHFASFPTHALPTGFQEYYVLGYEEHVWRAFDTIYDGSIPNWICSTIGLVATADYQVVYYDHWEDGYEADLLNPTQSSTEIYHLSVGASLSLTSTQTNGPTINQAIPIPRSQSSDPSNLRYDGGDRIITSGGPVALTHVMWPVNSSWAGGGWEVYSGQVYAETYTYHLPIGEDLYAFGGGDNGAYGDFRNVFLELGAFEQDTIVSIDNGDQVVTLSLDQGQTYSSQGYINSSSAPTISINTSTVIRANRPIQVGLMTGADSPPAGFQSRFFMVMPDQHWGADYVVPNPRGDNSTDNNRDAPAEVYLSNPNDFPITINAYDRSTQTTFSINPRTSTSSTVPYSQVRGGFVPQDSAARFTSSDGSFGIVVCADTSETGYDWGFSGFPAKYLTQDYYVSWAPGNSCTPPDSPGCINGSPVWVTPLADGTTFYADFSPLDGVPDQSFTLDSLEQRRIFDNVDNDNTGMHIWATGKFAVAWGEDPRTAGASTPYLDLGLTTLPLQQTWLDPVLTIEATSEPTMLPPAGGTVTFTLVARSYDLPLEDVAITNTLPVSWTYVSSSTNVTYPGGGMASPEPVTSDQILSWDLSAYLDANQSLTLTFQAQITDTGAISISVSQSEAIGRDESTGTLFNPTDDTIVYISPIIMVKSVSATQAEIGDTLVYTTFYVNRSTGTTVTDAILHDVIPIQHVALQSTSSGGTYNPASSTITWALGTLTPGVSGSVAFTVTINKFVEDGTVIENMAFLSSQGIKWAGSNTVRTTALAPNVRLVKVGPAVTHRGNAITYTLSYENIGGAQASGVTIQDIVPLSTSYLTGTLSIFTGTEWVTLSEAEDNDQGSYISPTLTITPGVVPGIIAPGETGQIRLSVRTDAQLPSGSFIQNWATLDHDLANPRDTNLVITHIADLLIGKRAHQATALPGDVITYTLTYTNVSLTSPQTDVYVREAIPRHTSFLTAAEFGDNQIEYSWNNGASWHPTLPITPVTDIRWYDAEVPANTQGLASFTVLVTTTQPSSTIIENTAHITSANLAQYSQEWIPSNQVTVYLIPEVDFSTTSYLVNESAGTAVVKVTLSAASNLPVTVDYVSSEGTAAADDDYTAISGTLRFPPLSITQTFTVSITDDVIDEPDETVILNLTGATNATVGTNHNPATLIILDDDPLPTADFVTSSFSASETVPSAIITVSLSHPSGFPVTVDYVSADGTATLDDDYTATSGTLHFPPLSTTQTFTVAVIDDLIDEPDETVVLTLTGATSATVGTDRNPAALIILDDDPLPIADFVTSSFSVSETVPLAIITVSLSHPSGLTVTVDYVFADGTATLGDDYAATSGTLRFPPLSTTQVLTVAIIDDPADELDETVVLTLTTATHAAVGINHNPATLVIVDDDPESAVVYGTVFLDRNGSGIQDAGELGIPDVLVAVDAASLSIITTTTDSDGKYALYTTVEGVHTVIETDPRIEQPLAVGENQIAPMDLFDYISTTPNEVHIDVVFRNAYQVDFGDGLTNLGFAPIYGVAFKDTDGDGVQGASELGISNVVITLTAPSLEVFTTTTDLYGKYTLHTTTPGAHVIVAAKPSGYFATSPNEIHLNVTLGEAYQVDFGNATAGSSFGTIYGTVFDDENGDGVYDEDETGISSVLITLNAVSRPAITTTTDFHGSYTLSTDVAGLHTLVETDPDGYTSSTSSQVDLDVTLDVGYQVNFGDLEVSACAPDMYEEDDSASQARQFTIGTIQLHQFCDDAVDWIRFTAWANSAYTITTHVRGQRADTILTLFDTDGQTEVAANDNYTGTADLSSRIVWKAPASGDYYIRITNKNSLIGQRTDYDLHIDADDLSTVYMPIVMRGS